MNFTEIAKKREFIVRGIHAQKCIKAEHFPSSASFKFRSFNVKQEKLKRKNDWTW
jgi:hypothetical protein